MIDPQRLLRTGQVAALLGMSTGRVAQWAKAGKLPHSTTPGGHYRYPEAAIRQLARQLVAPPSAPGNRRAGA